MMQIMFGRKINGNPWKKIKENGLYSHTEEDRSFKSLLTQSSVELLFYFVG